MKKFQRENYTPTRWARRGVDELKTRSRFIYLSMSND